MLLDVNFNHEKSDWDEFIRLSPQATIFAETQFLDSLQLKYDLVTCSRNGKIEIGALLIKGDDGLVRKTPYPFTQFQGVFLSAEPRKIGQARIGVQFKNLQFLLGVLESRYDEFLLVNSWKLEDMRPFLWHNYGELGKKKIDLDLRYTGIINLNPYSCMDDYIASVRPCRRQEYKKLQKLITIESSDEIDILEALHEKTFDRQGLKRNSKDVEIMHEICKNALQKGFGRLKVARLEGVPIAASFFVNDVSTAYYLIGASDPEYRKLSAGTGLIFSVIEEFFGENIKTIDMVGVNSPNRGDYKISFNAELRSYYIATYS
ncbi:GNAT family N-acetyltransferase [Polynucleobacter paneuropaeus]|jgi:hypothetical protein|uniref:GNAT family N-acetyltransferase n=1 Tax=Polynucleobacter paneuropaeus TaxID=2527775 RepID=UPI001BFE5709|nr:GNAT family N-acetyltransferase [Polynucleobacter paneuropaeus]MBT8621883.1 GNAT family N-acetyltransferase [Polynucleobacter paneuropaeus]